MSGRGSAPAGARRISIKHKLLALTMFCCAVAVMLTGGLMVVFMTSVYEARVIDALSANTRIIASNCSAAVQFDDARDAAEVLAALSLRPTVAYACIRRADGRPLAEHRRAGFEGPILPTTTQAGPVVDRQWMSVSEPVLVDGRAIGEVMVQSDLSELRSFRGYMLRLVVGLLLSVLLLVFFLTSWLQMLVAGPLEYLTEVARKVSVTRDYTLRAEVSSADEVGLLTRAFNEMLAEVEQREKDLRRARDYIAGIIDSMPSMIIGVDAESVVTQWNVEAVAATGIAREKALSKRLGEVLPVLADETALVRKAIESREKQFLSREVETREGHRWEEITVFPLVVGGGAGAVIRVDDVTQRRQLEEQLNQTRKMDALGQLAGGVAHDFNNMLGGIMGGAELLEEYIPDEPQPRHYLTMINTAAGRAASLAKQLLAFGRKHKRSAAPADVRGIIDETAAMLRNTIDKRIAVAVTHRAERSLITGDPAQVQNVLLNLGINASHAMPEGGTLSLETSLAVVDERYCSHSAFTLRPGAYLRIDVRDTGCGMSPAIRKRIFEPFFTTKEQGKGTGLGLSAAYGTVVQHGGEITVNSEEGVGTCFHILLPLSEAESVADADRDDGVTTPGSGLILVVDDEEIMRSTGKAHLEGGGYEVMVAKDGEEAVSRYREHGSRIDLVVCDMIMPKMNGQDCFAALQTIDPEVRMILVSGFSSEEQVAAMKHRGLHGFLRKPYRGAELLALVSKVLRGQHGTEWDGFR